MTSQVTKLKRNRHFLFLFHPSKLGVARSIRAGHTTLPPLSILPSQLDSYRYRRIYLKDVAGHRKLIKELDARPDSNDIPSVLTAKTPSTPRRYRYNEIQYSWRSLRLGGEKD